MKEKGTEANVLRSILQLGKVRIRCAQTRNVRDCFECKLNTYFDCEEWQKHQTRFEKFMDGLSQLLFSV